MHKTLSIMLMLPQENDRGTNSPRGEMPGQESSEQELVERAKHGDVEAFGELYQTHYEAILTYLLRRTLNLAIAEDLTSITFMKALQALPKYRHRTALRAWLYQIATNELRMHWRRQRRHPEESQDENWQAAIDRIAFTEHGILAHIDQEELMQKFAVLHHALQELPEKYQTALVLHYFEGLPDEAVAQIMGKRLGTVRSLIYRGIQKLRTYF